MNYKINVTQIDSAWTVCNFKLRVFVEMKTFSMEYFNYVLETLKKWFGDAEYFWSEKDEVMFLCDRK